MCLHKYFQEDCRYDSDCFRSLIHTYWTTSHRNIMTPKTNIAKTPHLLGQQLPFWLFLTKFLPTGASISIFSQQLLTKILENVFLALKLPQSKYHLIWTPRSKENQFQRSLFRGRPFEISTFIFKILDFRAGRRATILSVFFFKAARRPQKKKK